MEKKRARKTVTIILTMLVFVAVFTYLVSFLIRGYRPSIDQKGLGLLPTGLLVADSDPKGASVFINGKLATATDDTLNLSPESYEIKIEKDGYLPWQKNLTIKKEVVTQTNAILFRNTPDLKPLTTTGAINPTVSADKTKIVYVVTNASSASKNGIWVLEIGTGLPLGRSNNRQITGPITDIDWQKSHFVWEPNGKSVIIIETYEDNKKNLLVKNAFQIAIDRFTAVDQLTDVSFRLSLILEDWRGMEKEELTAKMAKLPEELIKIASTSATIITFSPDDERFFYVATGKIKIPENLIPHPPARSAQTESREIEPGKIYIYNIKEDANFLIGSLEELGLDPEDINQDGPAYTKGRKVISLHWLTTNQLVFIDKEKKEVKAIESDSTNRQTIYAGPFENGFVFPSVSGKSLITLTSLHPDSPGNLYEIKVR